MLILKLLKATSFTNLLPTYQDEKKNKKKQYNLTRKTLLPRNSVSEKYKN